MQKISEISIGKIVEELRDELKNGVLLENGKYKLEEKSIAHINGLKIQIFFDEHPPPHFNIIDGNGNSNDYTIDNCEPLNKGSLSKYYRNIKKWHSKNKDILIKAWDNSRPTNCSVGMIRNKSV